MLQVTVDIFSGNPNPSWIINDDEADAILVEIEKNHEVIAEDSSGYQELGYRGILLEVLEDGFQYNYDIPSVFKIANGASKNESKGLEIGERLIDNMLNYSYLGILSEAFPAWDQDFQDFLSDELKSFPSIISKGFPDLSVIEDDEIAEPVEEFDMEERKASKASCSITLGRYNPGFWNNNSTTKLRNNCYNYARNWRTNTFAQPGRATGCYPYSISCSNVTRGALCDGAHKRFDCVPSSQKPRWFMAMVVWPGRDYHWYRKHIGGFWGHKPGSTNARKTDNSGKVIKNPKTCNRGNYTDFCGYFYARKGMKIR